MKTIMVLSDTHGNVAAFEPIKMQLAECDYIYHLGDTSTDGYILKKQYPEKVRLLNGNCDQLPVGYREFTEEIEGVNVFACHGDVYGVKQRLDNLCYRAQELNCKLALYGHTHEAREDNLGGVTLVNPGTLSRYSTKSYAYIVIHQGKITVNIVPLRD